jgi:outer membrane murein-binding lipoprotein Lpp
VAWIPVLVWIGAVVVALLVLGYCAYEITGKSRRLNREMVRLQTVSERVHRLQADVSAVRQRVAEPGRS